MTYLPFLFIGVLLLISYFLLRQRSALVEDKVRLEKEWGDLLSAEEKRSARFRAERDSAIKELFEVTINRDNWKRDCEHAYEQHIAIDGALSGLLDLPNSTRAEKIRSLRQQLDICRELRELDAVSIRKLREEVTQARTDLARASEDHAYWHNEAGRLKVEVELLRGVSPAAIKTKPLRRKKQYRDLRNGEVIRVTDEYLLGSKWVSRRGDPEVGNKFEKGIHLPTRRPICSAS